MLDISVVAATLRIEVRYSGWVGGTGAIRDYVAGMFDSTASLSREFSPARVYR